MFHDDRCITSYPVKKEGAALRRPLFLQSGTGGSVFTRRLQEEVEKARKHEEWEVEYMTLFMKIREEREEAAIEQLIETARKYNVSDENISRDLMSKFQLTRDEALARIKEYDLQPA